PVRMRKTSGCLKPARPEPLPMLLRLSSDGRGSFCGPILATIPHKRDLMHKYRLCMLAAYAHILITVVCIYAPLAVGNALASAVPDKTASHCGADLFTKLSKGAQPALEPIRGDAYGIPVSLVEMARASNRAIEK